MSSYREQRGHSVRISDQSKRPHVRRSDPANVVWGGFESPSAPRLGPVPLPPTPTLYLRPFPEADPWPRSNDASSRDAIDARASSHHSIHGSPQSARTTPSLNAPAPSANGGLGVPAYPPEHCQWATLQRDAYSSRTPPRPAHAVAIPSSRAWQPPMESLRARETARSTASRTPGMGSRLLHACRGLGARVLRSLLCTSCY